MTDLEEFFFHSCQCSFGLGTSDLVGHLCASHNLCVEEIRGAGLRYSQWIGLCVH